MNREHAVRQPCPWRAAPPAAASQPEPGRRVRAGPL